MQIGITKILATINDLKETAVDGVALVKAMARGPFGLGAILAAAVQIAGDVKSLLANAPGALPEFQDLDSAEVGQISTAAYDCVKDILAALAA